MKPRVDQSPRWIERPHTAIIVALLVVLTLTAYWRMMNAEFIAYDDTDYVTTNQRVQQGLTWSNVRWAFTAMEASNWHPVTWLSHMLDCQLWGANAARHHQTNILLHIVNACLLFGLLRFMTRAPWRSALVAALFAVHPLHVESVAWIAERKDLLSTMFGLLAMWCYVRYARGAVNWYGLLLILFVLSLLAKPMLVTLPFVLLLLDYWPLRRIFGDSSATPAVAQAWTWGGAWVLIVEKLPLLALAAGSSVMTVLAQRGGGAVYSLEALPLKFRLMNAAVSYATYIGKMFWPAKLAVLYPFPEEGAWDVIRVVVSIGVVVGVCVLVFVLSRPPRRIFDKRPWLVVGWLWFVGTLVPVIGLVQVGYQSMADRYTYVPLIGLFIMIAWSVPSFGSTIGRGVKQGIIGAALIALVALTVATIIQTAHWHDSKSLFNHTLRLTERNFIIEYNLGYVLRLDGNNVDAARHFSNALAIEPEYSPAHDNLGNALLALERYAEALPHYQAAVLLQPTKASVRNNLGSCLTKLERFSEGEAAYRESIRLDPQIASVHANLGTSLLYQRKYEQAVQAYQEALRLDSGIVDAHTGMGRALAMLLRVDEAIAQFKEALRLKPDDVDAAFFLNKAIEGKARMEKANP